MPIARSEHLDTGSYRKRRARLGNSIPISPDKNRCQTSTRVCEVMTAAILARVDEFKLSPLEIQARYPTFRKGYLSAMQTGTLFGEKRLMAICEAIGLFPIITFVDTARQQASVLEAA